MDKRKQVLEAKRPNCLIKNILLLGIKNKKTKLKNKIKKINVKIINLLYGLKKTLKINDRFHQKQCLGFL